MMQIVPLQAIPSQQVLTTLDNVTVQINVYQLRTGMFFDLLVGGTLEIGAVICENLNRMIRNNYLNVTAGFAGDFVFSDTQGTDDPDYTGLGSRFVLIYLSPDDLAVLGVSDT
jgi:hypothetical protein